MYSSNESSVRWATSDSSSAHWGSFSSSFGGPGLCGKWTGWDLFSNRDYLIFLNCKTNLSTVDLNINKQERQYYLLGGLPQKSYNEIMSLFHDFSMTICAVFHDARKENTEDHLRMFITYMKRKSSLIVN